MEISEREHHIKVLEKMFYGMEKLENGVILPTSEVKTALAYAISSLKTDLKYDLLYEGEDVYSKADMVAMLTDLERRIKMSCQSCKHWRPTYAPYVKHGYPYIMTCRKENKDKQEFGDKCKYWESVDEDTNSTSNSLGGISDRL